MTNEAFSHLLWRYENGLCTREEEEKLEAWYASLDDAVQEAAISKEDRSKIKTATLQAIRKSVLRPPLLRTVFFNYRKIWLAAATVLITLGSWWLLKKGDDHATQQVFFNHDQVARSFTLQDGSLVILDSGATLQYSEWSTSKRKVVLTGSAFFDIHKDSTRPFWVYSNNWVTKVLGTSFRVDNSTDSSSVAVQSGRVAVYKASAKPDYELETADAILTPNQQVLLVKANNHIQKSIVKKPLPVAIISNEKPLKTSFDDDPLSEVLTSLSALYQIEMTAENTALLKCPVSGDISGADISMYDKIELICKTINAQYEIKENTILIRGSGCN